ncbi:MAG: UvrD-helicase domain-containing protein [Candidatus Marinimicrobia bacterium]|nr:UvrD-helicase domain-containing protein [Candidatus Neomarinimicrobiota bacterium]MBT3634107.1 UvrD-helicase domain-containing protein [Candidatus Neomarinimicrobiota bacterium]MBT3683019.1 UvrD-helicase domain-containing protein [Candidatus Neomarinimicrobiota bacterium]MBT3759889.1 UvrD-helicase domain-containing protein [Candidatus Neomarinimicrobiota bacterium]MBT3895658.1 UvrD-helicase domain-containing protein [Candidatus Neomarinimicrobiota bacterium]
MNNQNNLNKQQREAVLEIESPVLIFAGAGSGKTRVLTQKIVHLIESNIYPAHKILSVTFTNKAATEMKTRVKSMLPEMNDSSLSIGTFHSIAARILRFEAQYLGYERSFTIYDTEDGKKLIKDIVKEMDLNASMYNARNILSIISSNKNNFVSPDELREKSKNPYETKMADIYEKYQERLINNNAMDFDELLLQPLYLFRDFPERLEFYRQRYQYILVDEYQDTNKPQFEFVKYLAGDHQRITVVGDDDQSIYGWRGADITNILEFEKTFPDANIIKLEQNYRSTKHILKAAHSVVKHNTKRSPKELWTDNNDGSLITLKQSEDERGEAKFIVSRIQRSYKSDNKKFGDFAILYRTNAQSRAIEEKLIHGTIPYSIVGGLKFFERKEIKDVLAYLRLIANVKDNISFERVVNFPTRGLGMTTIRKLSIRAGQLNQSLLEAMETTETLEIRPAQKEVMKKFKVLIDDLKSQSDSKPAVEICRSLIKEISLEAHYLNQNSEDEADRWNNVEELIRGIELFCDENPEAKLSDYLENVSLQTDLDRWNDAKDSITLMTVHSAKGLEFPVVFITGLEERLFPLRVNDEQDLDEERRLFYVAMTRAKEKVYLTHAQFRRRYGGDAPSYMMRSEFIDHIPSEILDEIKLPANKKISTGNYPDLEFWQANSYRGQKNKLAGDKQIEGEGDFKVNQIVDHKMWGRGKVLSIEGMGEKAKITVLFSGDIRKKLIAKYAGLKLLSS